MLWIVSRCFVPTFLLLLTFPCKTKSWTIGVPLRVPDLRMTSTRLQLAKEEENQEPQQTNANPPPPRRLLHRPSLRRSVSTVTVKEIQDRNKKAQERHEEALKDPTLLTDTKFSDLELAPATVRAVTEIMGLQRMTEIQAKAWLPAVTGKSILGRARTGTGKTIAFLLPAIQRLLEADLTVYRPGRNIGVIIIVPTRELAMQIAEQASALLTYHKQHQSSWTVQSVYGGCSIQRDRGLLNQRIPAILVATPGRLLDLLKLRTRITGNGQFSDIVGDTKIVVLDEADRLLQAFPTEMTKILSYLPRVDKRQTMLFSATIPARLNSKLSSTLEANNILPSDYLRVDCVRDNDVSTQTNMRVEQSYVQLRDMKSYLTGLISIVQEAMREDPDHFKIVIFFPTAKLVKFVADALNTVNMLEIPTAVLSIHSRMGQGARNKASSQFRQASRSILLTSDVSARGVDYNDVTDVIQYGAPYNEELYLHRLGRTGRAGKQGSGLVVLFPFEKSFKSKLRRRNVTENTGGFANVNNPHPGIEAKVDALKQLVRSGHAVLTPSAETACKSFVAHYLEYAVAGVSGRDVAEAVSDLADSFGLVEVPSFPDDFKAKLHNGK